MRNNRRLRPLGLPKTSRMTASKKKWVAMVFEIVHHLLGRLIQQLIQERQAAKASRDFARADAIRQSLLAEGIALQDSAQGTQWVKV